MNTNTFIIGNISPSSKNIDETLNTLKFAERASHITMKVKPLEYSEMNPDAVDRLKKEIAYLKGLLNRKGEGGEDAMKNQGNDSNNGPLTQKEF